MTLSPTSMKMYTVTKGDLVENVANDAVNILGGAVDVAADVAGGAVNVAADVAGGVVNAAEDIVTGVVGNEDPVCNAANEAFQTGLE